MEETIVSVVFPNKELADHFVGWMADGGGEDGMYDSTEYHLDTRLLFDYWTSPGNIIVSVAEEEE